MGELGIQLTLIKYTFYSNSKSINWYNSSWFLL